MSLIFLGNFSGKFGAVHVAWYKQQQISKADEVIGFVKRSSTCAAKLARTRTQQQPHSDETHSKYKRYTTAEVDKEVSTEDHRRSVLRMRPAVPGLLAI